MRLPLAVAIVMSLSMTGAGTVATTCVPERGIVTDLFNALNLSISKLQPVKTALEKNDTSSAMEALVEYYQQSNSNHWWRLPSTPVPSSRKAGGVADDALRDKYSFYSEDAVVPRLGNGSLDWQCVGPVHDVEFRYALNRHSIYQTLTEVSIGADRNCDLNKWCCRLGMRPETASTNSCTTT